MAELGFSTYVFIERIAANAAALHPFPEHNVALVRDALADAGFEISLLGPDAPEVGEGVYFQPEPFGDEVMGLLADALTLRGIGAYGYALVDSSLGGDLADMGVAVGAVTGDGHEQGARTRLTGIRDDTSDDTSIGAVIGAAGSTAGSGDLGKGAGNHAGVTGPHFASAASRMTGASL